MSADPICGVSSLGELPAEPDSGPEVVEELDGVLDEAARSARHAVDEKARRMTEAVLWRLRQAKQRGLPLRAAPDRMRLAANQLELCIELISDMRTGRYREISWPKALVLSGAILYSVSPMDVIPDTVPALGAIDDAIVLAVAVNLVREELVTYCTLRGYDPEKYFPVS
jgi:uncharacterized membrane protein YkvA (DUF1232 family)